MKEEIFWLDGFEGKARGGLYIRNDVFKFFEKCKKQGIKIVGIKKPKDWTMELMFEDKS